jgi:hypothetical protein
MTFHYGPTVKKSYHLNTATIRNKPPTHELLEDKPFKPWPFI